LVCHLLLSTLRTFAFGFGAVCDILLECSLNTILPCVDTLAIEVQAIDKVYNLVDWHAMSQYSRDELGVVPELLIEQA
jgi:hypothetical protein